MIYHFVSDKRCRFSYFLSRCYAEGISKAQVTANVGTNAGLAAERTYVTRTLPLGVLSGIIDLFRGLPAGLGRAGAIMAGFGATVTGYIVGRLSAITKNPDRTHRLQTT
jgi:hypothetical protein